MMSRDEALSEVFRAVSESNVEFETVGDIFKFAVGFFCGKGLPGDVARRFAIDAASSGFWPQLHSLEVAAFAASV